MASPPAPAVGAACLPMPPTPGLVGWVSISVAVRFNSGFVDVAFNTAVSLPCIYAVFESWPGGEL